MNSTVLNRYATLYTYSMLYYLYCLMIIQMIICTDNLYNLFNDNFYCRIIQMQIALTSPSRPIPIFTLCDILSKLL